jgi:hypothetical protein
VKDPQGRYLCQPCFDTVKAAKAERPRASPAPVDPPAEEGIFGMVDLDALQPVETGPKPRELKVCPACGKAREKDSVVCVNCGFDDRAGFQRGTGVGASSRKGGTTTCPGCGYDLKGLKKPRCPECGKVLPLVTDREDRDAESKSIARKAYLRPVLMFVIGIMGLLILGAVRGHGGPDMIVRLLLTYAIGVPIGLLVYVICCLIWIGFNAPLHRVALSLAGIYAIVDLVGAVLGLIPMAIIAWAGSVITYVGLLMEELDLDLVDAVIVGIVTSLAKVFLGVMLVALAVGLFK